LYCRVWPLCVISPPTRSERVTITGAVTVVPVHPM
jgi:hypothetical protein